MQITVKKENRGVDAPSKRRRPRRIAKAFLILILGPTDPTRTDMIKTTALTAGTM